MGSGPPLCDGCRARITFVTVTKAAGGTSRMVLDAEPDLGGNVAVRPSGQSKVGRVLGRNRAIASDEVIYMPHHATCTDPPKRRKPVVRTVQPASAPPKPATLFDPS